MKIEKIQVTAYTIFALEGGKRKSIPDDFFSWLSGVNFQSRWLPTPSIGQQSANIQAFNRLSNPNDYSKHSGRYVEVTLRDAIPVIDLGDGSDSEHPLPHGKGEHQTWRFILRSDSNFLLMEDKGRAAEKKLQQFLKGQLNEFRKTKNERLFDDLIIESIPKEEDPVGFLRTNPSLKSFEARLSAKALSDSTKYGVISDWFGGLDGANEFLKVKIEVSTTKRGEGLPQVLTSKLADFLGSIEEDQSMQSIVKEMKDGRTSARPTWLLDAI